MKNHSTKNLRGELESAGATTSEIDELIAVASNINKLKSSKNLAVKPSIKRRRQINWKGLVPVGVTSLSGLALGMALVILSQTVLPGSLLYPVQKFSDTIAISLNTNYRGTVMMKRAQEVKQLIAKHANSNLVLATLANYQTEASAYTSVSANYAVFEYCKSNLRQAADMAPNPERQAIDNTLLSLKNV